MRSRPVLRAFARLITFAFFRSVECEGLDRVPAAGPVLLVSNHTNALVDPFVIQSRLRRPLTITAKSALRQNVFLAFLIRLFNVILFYRRQDREVEDQPGSGNADAIRECATRLAGGGALCIFPEGVSHSDLAMRPFKTGAARIAFEYLDRNEGPDLTIVPVGLHFESKGSFRSRVWLAAGEPLRLAEWSGDPSEDRVALLTAEIERRVQTVTVGFDSQAEADLFVWAAEIAATGGIQPAALGQPERNGYGARIKLVQRIQRAYRTLIANGENREQIADLAARITAFRTTLHREGIAPGELYLPLHPGRVAFFLIRELELLLFGLPLSLWGIVNHAPGFLTVQRIARKMSTDEDHFASNAVFMGIPVFFLFYLAQTAAVGLVFSLPAALFYAATLPYCGALALLYRDRVGGASNRATTFVRFLFRPALRGKLVAEGNDILSELQRLAARTEAT